MGAWGIKTFENDDASDWLYDLEESNDLSVITKALDLANSDYIESSDGCCILAAAEIILALQDQAMPDLPDNAAEWVSANENLDASDLVGKAIEAIDNVLSDFSELNELWQESDEDYQAWIEEVTELKNALQSS